MWASDDWQRFVIQTEPMHGIPVGAVEIVARDAHLLEPSSHSPDLRLIAASAQMSSASAIRAYRAPGDH